MLNCKQTTALLSQRQDRPLSLWEQWQLRTHLLMCPHCRRYRRQINIISDGMAQLRTQTTAADDTTDPR